MGRALWRHLSTLAVAFFLAGLVWVVATNQANPVEERVFETPLPVQLINPPAGMILVDVSTQVATVTVRAPRSILESLTASQIQLTADLAGLPAGVHTVPLHWQIEKSVARVINTEPAAISVAFEPRAERDFELNFVYLGEPALGYEAGTEMTPLTVTVTGPESNVARVWEVKVSIVLDNLKSNYNHSMTPVPLDETGQPVEGVTVVPPQVPIQVPVTQKLGFREVTVTPVITGQVAAGYRITNITVAPLVVTVSSANPELVSNLPGYVETEPLDVSGWNDDRVVRLAPVLPAGVVLVNEQSVVVQVSIAAIEYRLTVPRPVEFDGLGAGLEAVAVPAEVELVLAGPLPVLNRLELEDARVLLDVSDLTLGTYELEPRVRLAFPELRVEQIDTTLIKVTLRRASTPRPSPPPTRTPTRKPK